MAPARRSGTLFCVGLIGKGALVALLAVLLAYHLALAAPSQPAKKVLLLYSYQAVLPTAVEWDGAIRRALEDSPTEPKEFYTEFLDLAQFPDEVYLQNLLNLLKSKYANRKIDLLIPVGDLAFSFLQAHRKALNSGAIAFLQKPVDEQTLLQAVKAASQGKAT